MKILHIFDSLKFVVAAIVCTFILNVAHAATLPAGYTELEYLESTVASSQAYIDTGLNFNSDYMYEINFLQSNVHNTIMGAAIEAYNKKGTFILTYCNDNVCFYSSTTSASLHSSLSLPNNVRHTAKYQQSTKTALLDDRNVWSASWITDENIPYNIFLFASNTAGNAVGGRSGYLRIYSYRVKDAGGVLIQNLVPARRDSDGVLGMYDLEDSNPETAFHTNAGTGEFIAGEYQIKIATTHYNETKFAPVETRLDAAVAAVDTVVTQTMSQAQQIDDIANNKQTRPDEGCPAKYCLLVEDEDGTPHWYPIAGANGVAHNLPAGYTELQYIESTGTQYIDTGYIPNSNTRWELDNEYTETPPAKHFFNGVYQYQSGQPARFDIALAETGLILNYGATNNVNSNVSSFINTRYMYVVDAKNNKWAYNDTTGSFPSYSNMTTITKPLYLFARNDGSGVDRFAKQRTYSSKIYDDGILVRDFVPAKNSSGVVGMYDMVSGQFFTNQGTGTFVAGPDM